MGLNRNINDDNTLAYLFNKTRQGASDALEKAVAYLKGLIDDKVSKTGDTMTGLLKILRSSGTHLTLQNSVDEKNVTPASTTNPITISFYDKNGGSYGYIRARHTNDGRIGLWLYAIASVGGTDYTNTLQLYVDPSTGERTVGITVAAWLKALGIGTDGALPITIAQGGTGATNAVDGLMALQGRPWKASGSFASGGTASRTITFSSTSRGIFYINGTNVGRFGMFLFYGTATTAVVQEIYKGSNITVTTSANTITVTNSSTSNAYIYMEFFTSGGYSVTTIS